MVKRKSTDAELAEVDVRFKKAMRVKKDNAPSAAQQKAQVSEVANVLQIDSKTAAKLLAKSGWSTSVAINGFYSNPNNNNSASNATRKALDQIFDKYRTNPKESPNELDIEGTGSLLEDLGIELDNCAALYFFEFTKSPQLGVITREGFTSGPLVEAGCDTPDKIRKHIYDQLITNNGTLEQYKAAYNHTFTLLIEDRKKAIDLEQAEAFWRILTDSNVGLPWTPKKGGADFLPMWLEFLNTKWQKAVNRDLWRQTLSFMLKAVEDESLGFWTEESSWPSVIDDFVLWVKVEKRGEAMEE